MTEAVFDLTGYSGVVQIMFRLGTDGSATEEGWYVDDISVSGGPVNTEVGSPSVVEPMTGCTITFDQVDAAGNTTVTMGSTGPTPPGTGVIRLAFSLTASKSTSPTRRDPPFAEGF